MYLIPKVQKTLTADPYLSNKPMDTIVKKASIALVMTLFFQLLTNNNCQGNFLTNYTSNLLIVTYFYLFMKSIWHKVSQKQLCWSPTCLVSFGFSWNLSARALKHIFPLHCNFFFEVFLFIEQPRIFLRL